MIRILEGDVIEMLRTLPDQCIHMITTSPPYLNQRDYGTAKWDGGDPNCDHVANKSKTKKMGNEEFNKNRPCRELTLTPGYYKDTCPKCGAIRIDNQIGLEKTPEEYVDKMVGVMREVKRVLRDDGIVWLNEGDGYAGSGAHTSEHENPGISQAGKRGADVAIKVSPGFKNKDLMMIPARVAIALQADGWWLRSQIPWLKRNCLSGGTWVYAKTQKGTMPTTIKDIARLDPKTVQLWDGEKWNQVTGIYEEDYSNRDVLLEIEFRNGERIGCTTDHRWPTTRGLIHSKDLVVGDIIEQCCLPDNDLSPLLLDDHDIGWLCGLYLSEGHYDNKTIIFSGHIKETEERFSRLEKIIKSYHGSIWINKSLGNGQKIVISGKGIIGIIHQYICGDNCRTKHLTTKAWNRNNTFLKSLIEGYLEGDGHFEKINKRWRLGFTDNHQLAIDIRTICARLGYNITLKQAFVTAGEEGKKYPSYRGEIRTTPHKPCKIPNTFTPVIKSQIIAIRKSKSRKMWDIALEKEPHSFALASGILTHNSMPESITDRPSSAVEYIFMLTKSGAPLFWVHRDGRGARTRPQPDYRYLDLLENKEYVEKPEGFNSKDKLPCPTCDGSGELSQGWFAYVDTCPVCSGKGKVRRWARINLWTGDDYFYDPDAIRVPLYLDTLPRYSRGMKDDNKWAEGPPSCAKSLNRGERWNRNSGQKMGGTGYGGDGTGFNKHSGYYDSNGELLVNPDGRNRRNSDWFFESWQGLYVEDQQPLAMIVNPQPYPGMHFATFPYKLVEPCIKAGTSEKGCCPKCGAPWVRMVEKGDPVEEWKQASGADVEGGYNGHSWKHEKMIHGKTGHFHEKEKKQDLAGNPTYTGFNQRYKEKQQNASDVKRRVLAGMVEKKTVAWQPTCECGETGTVPCVVLDPFMGSGRTLQVARDLMRDSIGIDLNHDYVLLARKELRLNEQLPV